MPTVNVQQTKMRVVHIITRLIVGGAQENTISTVLGLKEKQDVEVFLISGPTYGAEGSLVDTVRSVKLIEVPSLVRPVHPIKDVCALFSLIKYLKQIKPDIVHTHSGKAGVIGRIAAKIVKVPIIAHTIHGPSFGEFQGAIPNFVFLTAERLAGKFTTHFISVSQAMTDQYIRAGIGKPEQYSCIYSGFNLQPFIEAKNDLNIRKQYGIKPDDFVIGKIARLFKLKGHDDLFQIAPALVEKFKNIKFLIVGGGEWRGKFVDMAKSLNLQEHFVFTGLVQPDEIPELIGITDILVHLSRREGLPRSVIQALAGGKPVVVYDCDGAREVCLDGKTGFLIKPGDTNGLLEALTTLISNPSLRKTMGENGRKIALENFSQTKMVESIYELYKKLLRNSDVCKG